MFEALTLNDVPCTGVPFAVRSVVRTSVDFRCDLCALSETKRASDAAGGHSAVFASLLAV